MVTITATYEGDLCCTATHGPSGARISTDAPKDNEGLGRYFSPVQTLEAALGKIHERRLAATAAKNPTAT